MTRPLSFKGSELMQLPLPTFFLVKSLQGYMCLNRTLYPQKKEMTYAGQARSSSVGDL